MRCLSPPELEAIFSPFGFSVSLKHAWYRSALVLSEENAAGQIRVGARPPAELSTIGYFVRAINRWLPTNTERLLWIDHWEYIPYKFNDGIVVAARAGLGETRSLTDAPGHYFEKQNWDEEDQVDVTEGQERAMGLLEGIASMILMTSSDGWLIAEGSIDRIEFWEGNIFFHSKDAKQIERANALLDSFGCSRELK
jgi:hypothetical protein